MSADFTAVFKLATVTGIAIYAIAGIAWNLARAIARGQLIREQRGGAAKSDRHKST